VCQFGSAFFSFLEKQWFTHNLGSLGQLNRRMRVDVKGPRPTSAQVS